MIFDDYQKGAHTFAFYPKEQIPMYLALGLCGEAGEVANKIKKVYRDCNGEFSKDKIKEIRDELGDTLWYLSELANQLGISLFNVAYHNLNKLSNRHNKTYQYF